MYGQKAFVNNTPNTLSVTLTPRLGNTPGTDGPPQTFTMTPGATSLQTYGNDQNPFLDGISIAIVQNGNVIASQQFVATRSSSVDDDFNMHNTVTFTMSGNSVVLQYSNQ